VASNYPDKGTRGGVVRTSLSALFLTLLAGIPAWAQEALALGLKGPVHTVLTEEFGTPNGAAPSEPTGSVLEVYDPQGYQLEVFRYKADGSLWAHTVIDRKGTQLSRIQTTGTEPFQNQSIQYVYDAQGRVLEMDTYDANGAEVSKSTNEFAQEDGNSITVSRENNAGGTETKEEISETTDPETGVTHQVATRNGEPWTDWVIQRNKDGTVENNKIVYQDGSYNERERKADRTTVEDRYSALTKGHTYQKTDAQGHLIEVVEKSGSSYIRCTYSFDKDGRSTGQINYDAAGNVLDKSTAEYRDDSHGNWVEKKSIVWDAKSDLMRPKIAQTTLRTINYY
jgi:YD repeat-containing protein